MSIENVKLTYSLQLFHRLYQINTDKYTHILLNHHFLNTIRDSSMFHPSNDHLQQI
jgi:hypothetical protein